MADKQPETTEVQEEDQKVSQEEPKKDIGKANWADLDEEEGDDQEIGVQDASKKKKDRKGNWKKGVQQVEGEKKVFNPPPPRQKTEKGDYIVTSFQIPDRVSGPQGEDKQQTKSKKRNQGAFALDDSEEEEKEEEEEKQEETPVVEVEAPKVEQPQKSKQLSKKEMKKKEMEELDQLLNQAGTQPVKEEKKVEEAKVSQAAAGEGDAKKKKKKDKKKKKEEEKQEPGTEGTAKVEELTAEQKEAAVKEALKKRGGVQQQSKPKAGLIAAKIEKAERQQKSKKAKGDEYDR